LSDVKRLCRPGERTELSDFHEIAQPPEVETAVHEQKVTTTQKPLLGQTCKRLAQLGFPEPYLRLEYRRHYRGKTAPRAGMRAPINELRRQRQLPTIKQLIVK
jgi:hypothetical protein